MMNHTGTNPIETERLILRRFQTDDAFAMFSNWSNDEDAVRFLSWHAHKSLKDSEALIQKLVLQYEKLDVYTWAVVHKDNMEPIGYVNIHAINDRHKRGEISYCIGRSFWNKGFATEAVQAVVHYMLSQVGLNRIIGLYDVHNPSSGRVLEKAGFKLEGLLRQHELDKYERPQDLYICSILKGDLY